MNRKVQPPPTKYGSPTSQAKPQPQSPRLHAPPPFLSPVKATLSAACQPRMMPTRAYATIQAARAAKEIVKMDQGPKPPGKTYASWDAYHAKVTEWHGKIGDAKKAFNLSSVPYLYHATTSDAIDKISANGLLPRNPEWSGVYDASKDGVLSMAVSLAGAGAMGGKTVYLRVATADLAGLDFFVASGTEVRTFSAISPDVLYYRDASKNWVKLT